MAGAEAAGLARVAIVSLMRAAAVVPLQKDSVDLTAMPEPPADDGPVLVETVPSEYAGRISRSFTAPTDGHHQASSTVLRQDAQGRGRRVDIVGAVSARPPCRGIVA